MINGIKPKMTTAEHPEPPQARMLPCKTGIKAPPTIAIINPAEPIFASSPMSLRAIP